MSIEAILKQAEVVVEAKAILAKLFTTEKLRNEVLENVDEQFQEFLASELGDTYYPKTK